MSNVLCFSFISRCLYCVCCLLSHKMPKKIYTIKNTKKYISIHNMLAVKDEEERCPAGEQLKCNPQQQQQQHQQTKQNS